MKPEKIEEGKWVLHESIGVEFYSRVWNRWNRKFAYILWISIFIILGPLQVLLRNNSYEGSVIFGNNPFAYFMTQGLFIATFSVGLMYLIGSIMKKITLSKEKKKLHIT